MNPLVKNSDTKSVIDSEARALRGSGYGLWDWAVASDDFWWSPRAISLLELEPESDDLGLAGFLTCVHAADADNLREAIEACQDTGEPLDFACRVQVGRNGYRWFRLRGVLSRESDVGQAFVSGSLQDIHESRLAAEAVREQQQQQMQRQRMEAMDCLAGGIAHEFNNVLQAVGGYVSFARDDLDPASQAHDDLSQALTAVSRAAKLTRDLLDFARANEDDEELVDINSVVEGLLALLRPVLGADIDLRLRKSAVQLLTRANVLELRQALLNLCINARDAMPEGGALSVSAEPFRVSENDDVAGLQPGCYCRLFVTDSGVGISESSQRRVFDPFYSTKEVGKGTGLGLAAVYGFVQRSGGAIEVYSKPKPTGATFVIYLPVEEYAQVPEAIHDLPVGGRGTILIVEDDGPVRDVGRRMLEDAGYEVLCRPDGESGLEAYVEHAPAISLVVVDAVLPKLSGRRVYEEIRRLQSDVPVVFCTGHDPASVHGDGPKQIGDAVLAKPFDRAQFTSTVERLLGANKAEAGLL